MARLIVKSPYIKCGGSQGADGYMRYIATRERVEIIPDDRPPTRKQEQLITKLTKDFPDVKELLEYEDYTAHPTKAHASSLIALALEEHWKQVQQTDGYMQYIATRPRAERLGDHGLFGDADHVDLGAAMSELEHYTGNVWTHILPCTGRTRSGWATTTRRHGGPCSGRTATTSRRPCTSRRKTSAGTRRSMMKDTIPMST